MSKSSHGYDDQTVQRRLEEVATDTDHSPPLECIVVRYRDRSDRCTITPRECSEEEQLTTWLSADLSAAVDLETIR